MNPRGAIVMPSRPVDIGGETHVTGRKPGIVVQIHSTARTRRELDRFCNSVGIDAKPVQFARDGVPFAYECVGTVESLERLADHPIVIDWHLILNVRVPHLAGGSGDVTGNAERAARRAKIGRADREALEETERRAKLPAKQRHFIETDEEMERARVLAR